MMGLARWLGTLVVVLGLLAVPLSRAQDAKDAKKGAEAIGDEKAEKPANVVIKLYPDATLTIDGEKTEQTGGERKFTTPPLKPGVRYFYNAVAVWEPNNYTKITRTRKIYVYAGKDAVMDFTKDDPAAPKDSVFVRYVPTPQAVVDAMLKMGNVGKDDIVYDLGCGDGRIPITAVKTNLAKRGVGIDLDPQRIKESKENAKAADVEAKVEFRQADVLKLADLGDATVVTLYMGEDLNKLLKPILWKALKPGSRVVSHRFTMGDWKPEKTETIKVNGVEYKLHLWTIKGDERE